MPKTADEVAEQILEWTDDWSMKPIDMKAKIAVALTAARDEALEEAAKLCEDEDWSCPDCYDALMWDKAKDIRALKSAKQGAK